MLARLSIFRGGFQREAAQNVTGAHLKLLLSLTDKSLVRRAAGGRYEMLETLRKFAAEKLQNDPSAIEDTTRAHARHFLHLLHQQGPVLKAASQKEALTLLEPESENLRAAWRSALAHNDWLEISLALDGLFHFYELRGRFQEGHALFRDAIAMLDEDAPDARRLRPMLFSRRGWFAFRLGKYDRAEEDLNRSLGLARRYEQHEEIAFALHNLGLFSYQLGDYVSALQALQDSLHIWRALGDKHGEARVMSILGIVARERGDNDRAESYLARSLELHRATGDRRGISRCLNVLGLINRDRGKLAQARNLLQESLETCREIDDRRDVAFTCNILGAVLFEAGEYDGARDYCQESLEIREQIGERRGMAFSLHDLGNIATAIGNYDTAWAYLRRALSLARDIQAIPLALYVITGIAELRAAQGDATGAAELACFVRQHPSSFEMATERANRLLESLPNWPDIDGFHDIQFVASNFRFEDLIQSLLSA